MKRKFVKPILLALSAGITVLAACNKDDDEPLHPLVQKLTSSKWKIEEIVTPSINNPGTDSIITKTCNDDAEITFNTAGAFEFKDKTTGGCDSTVFPYDKGIWGIKNTEDSLLLVGIKKNQRMKLIKLTDDSLQVRFVDTLSATQNIQKTITFLH